MPENAETLVADSGDTESAAFAAADAEMLENCIRALCAEDRDIFLRKYYEEETVAEIARAYRKKPKDIENRLYRIRKTMRKMLETQYGKENVL